jgi:1-acyl-sn-glycerol-3-phosphate acyltransferase
MVARLALRVVGSRVTVEGLEHLPRRGPVILAANHTSYVDIAALMAMLPIDFVFVAKREVVSWPLVGTFVRKGRHLPVDRWDPQQSVADTDAIIRQLREGDAVLFFPEGTFTAADGLRPFRLGAFETAVTTGTPVVPIAIRGARRVLRSGASIPRPAPVHLWIGPPISPAGEGWRAAIRLRDQVADAIAAHCGEPRLDLVAGGPERPPAGALR